MRELHGSQFSALSGPSNGKPSDYVVMGKWTASRCPTFVQGWTNADGGARTSPTFGGPPNGGQWAVVRITSS